VYTVGVPYQTFIDDDGVLLSVCQGCNRYGELLYANERCGDCNLIHLAERLHQASMLDWVKAGHLDDRAFITGFWDRLDGDQFLEDLNPRLWRSLDVHWQDSYTAGWDSID
jgi:hypothetical protein